jgi:hypothetical protein
MVLAHFPTSCFKLTIMVLLQGRVDLFARPFVPATALIVDAATLLAGIFRDASLPICARKPQRYAGVRQQQV